MSFLQGQKAAGKAGANTRPAPSTANKPAARGPKVPTAGRYGGLGGAAPRHPFMRYGRYRVRIVSTKDFDGRNQDWFRAELEIVDAAEDAAHKKGDLVLYSQCVTKGDALAVGGPKVISFVMTAMGYQDEASFREAFPEDSQAAEDLMNRVAGVPLEETEIGPNPLAGMLLMVQATGTGKVDQKTGEEYHEYSWYVNEAEEG